MTGRLFVLYILIAALTLMPVSCTYRDLRALGRTMETDPAAADSLLDEIPVPACGRSLALYSLLRTQIDYKMYRTAESDSIIRIATDFYGTRYSSYYGALAWYSLGCLSSELGQDCTAADAYLTSLRLFPDTLVRYYALAEQNLGCIYLEHNMDEEAYRTLSSCLVNSVRLKDTTAIVFCEFNIARLLLYHNEYDSARFLFCDLLDKDRWMSPSTKGVPLLELSKIALYRDKDCESAISLADSFIIARQRQGNISAAFSIKAEAYYGMNRIDSTIHYNWLALSDASDPYTICSAYRSLAEIYSMNGYADSASYFTRQVNMWTDSIVARSGSADIFRTLNRKMQVSAGVPVFFPSLAFALIVILSVMVIVVKRKRKDNAGVRSQTLSDFDSDIVLFRQGNTYQYMVSVILSHEEPLQRQKNLFIYDFHNSLTGLRAFLSTAPAVNDNDIDFCIYTLLGFKQKDFSLLFNVAQIRTLKHRLKDKLPESLYVQIFNE